MNRGAWRATVLTVTEESDTTWCLSNTNKGSLGPYGFTANSIKYLKIYHQFFTNYYQKLILILCGKYDIKIRYQGEKSTVQYPLYMLN